MKLDIVYEEGFRVAVTKESFLEIINAYASDYNNSIDTHLELDRNMRFGVEGLYLSLHWASKEFYLVRLNDVSFFVSTEKNSCWIQDRKSNIIHNFELRNEFNFEQLKSWTDEHNLKPANDLKLANSFSNNTEGFSLKCSGDPGSADDKHRSLLFELFKGNNSLASFIVRVFNNEGSDVLAFKRSTLNLYPYEIIIEVNKTNETDYVRGLTLTKHYMDNVLDFSYAKYDVKSFGYTRDDSTICYTKQITITVEEQPIVITIGDNISVALD